MSVSHDILRLLGSSAPMTELAAQLERAATEPITLLVGETGVGKYHVARLLHASGRAAHEFIEVDCASSSRDSDGLAALIHACDGGRSPTAYLEEVAGLPLAGQDRLLSILSAMVTGANLRIIASTERDLPTEVTEGRFSEALYYSVGATPIYLPPLRARAPEDVRHIVSSLLHELRRGLPDAPRSVSDRALDLVARYHWPGNLRELRNALERALMSARGAPIIDVMHLPEEVLDTPAGTASVRASRRLADVERRHIERTLRAHGANRTHAARELGISRATLIKKIRDYGGA